MSSNGEGSSSAAASAGPDYTNLPALHHDAASFLAHDYDFIIIGGGTAGLVVAARLTENEDVKVGVLEAGKSRLGDFLVDSPAMFMQMFMNPEYDWCHMTEPQVRFNRSIFRPRMVRTTDILLRNTTMAVATTFLAARPWVDLQPVSRCCVSYSKTVTNRSRSQLHDVCARI
jgi:hypothetical protein